MKSKLLKRLIKFINPPEYLLENELDDAFQPLPKPTGDFPFRLEAATFISQKENYRFILAGDVGGVFIPDFQIRVANEMILRNPEFLYVLGDVVYNFGERENYYAQFFKPYQQLKAPIFAIPGNHDGDIDNPADKSLAAFVEVFCAKKASKVPFSKGAQRLSITQPHVYFTLVFEHFNIIGLYTNVPAIGVVRAEQKDWFIGELQQADKENKKILVCMHRPPYSFDTGHGASVPMQQFLTESFEQAGVYPQAVFSGHVHSYQHFEKMYGTHKVHFIVSGNGGYPNLHQLDTSAVKTLPTAFDDTTHLVAYHDTGHGFCELTTSGNVLQVVHCAISSSGDFVEVDRFTF